MTGRIPSFDLYDEIAPESVAHNPFIDSHPGKSYARVGERVLCALRGLV